MADAAEQGWVPQCASTLEKWIRAGMLTEAEAYEVNGVIELAIEKVRDGSISEQCASLLIRKMADEMAARLAARLKRWDGRE